MSDTLNYLPNSVRYSVSGETVKVHSSCTGNIIYCVYDFLLHAMFDFLKRSFGALMTSEDGLINLKHKQEYSFKILVA